nr:2-acylglycerol O-acyltransferase 3-like isoform X2 [Odocoileus virginianus texanus]
MQSGLGLSGWALCLLQPFPHKISTAPGGRPRWHIPYPASQPQAVASPDQPTGEVHGPFFSLLGVFLLFTSLWWLSALYAVWLFLDWDTPCQGGRRSQWMRNWVPWKQLRDYFPIKLIKTAELPSSRNCVLVTHPHGILSIGVFCNFCAEVTGSSQQFPRLQFSLAILNSLFYLPVYRDYVMSYGTRLKLTVEGQEVALEQRFCILAGRGAGDRGTCSVNHQSLDFILSQPQLGQAVLILVGGALEALHAVPGEHRLTLWNRKCFVRLALRHGASLVPVYSFGENDIFRVKVFAPDSWQRLFQVTIKKLLSFSPCIFWGRGLFSAKSWGLVPLARPITTVVGRPIPVPQCPQPTEEQVDHYHTLYTKVLEQLFEEHRRAVASRLLLASPSSSPGLTPVPLPACPPPPAPDPSA